MTRHTLAVAVAVVALTAPAGLGQERWELGFGAGYGFSTSNKVETSTREGDVGLRPGPLFSLYAGNSFHRHIGGEVRYTYRMSDLKVSSGGTEARMDGETHYIHYDLLFQSNRDAAVSIFAAGGGGVGVYRGTGRETAVQPLSDLALLTHTQQVLPVVSVGAGVRVRAGRLMSVRAEVRDYVGPFPKDVITPGLRATIRGWIHTFVPMVNIGFTF